jgi:hypothetical protein
MKPKYTIAILGVLLLAVVFVYLYGGGQTPFGQPPLRSLTAQNVGDIKGEFNAGKNEVRVLLLLSPT